MSQILAPKAKKLYEEFVAKYEADVNEKPLRSWDELSEGEQFEWAEFAGETPQVMGQAMHHPPIANQGEQGSNDGN